MCVNWAFAPGQYFHNPKEERTPEEIKADAIQGKIGEFAVFKFLKEERGYDLDEPDYKTVRKKGQTDSGDLYFGDVKIQIKTFTSKTRILRLKKEEWDGNGVYHNWNKKSVVYTHFFMCRIEPGVRKILSLIDPSEFNADKVIELLSNVKFKVEITGYLNISDFRKIISEEQYIPAGTLINGSFSYGEDFYYCLTGDLRDALDIPRKKKDD